MYIIYAAVGKTTINDNVYYNIYTRTLHSELHKNCTYYYYLVAVTIAS